MIGIISIIATWFIGYLFSQMKQIYRVRRDRLKESRLKQIDDLFSAIKVILSKSKLKPKFLLNLLKGNQKKRFRVKL